MANIEETKVNVTVLSGVSAGDVFNFSLQATKMIRIGRGTDCDLVLQDPSVSRNHALIESRDEGLFLVDSGSTHGTIHMGFKLTPGIEDARELKSNDEFKIGNMIFRINFVDRSAKAKKNSNEGVEKSKSDKLSLSEKLKKLDKKVLLIGVLALSLLALYFLLPSGKKKTSSPQKSHLVMNIPSRGVKGYLVDGSKSYQRDKSHLDKAQFYLPVSDQIIQYDFKGQPEVRVHIDESLVETLEPYTYGWQQRKIIIPDVMGGKERKIIFDNVDYPRKKGAKGGKIKKWGIRNLGTTLMQRELDSSFDKQLKATLALAESLDKTPESLFLITQGLQKCLLEMAMSIGVPGVDYSIDLESSFPTINELKGKLRAIISERERIDIDSTSKHLDVLIELTSELESEITRRVNSRMNSVKRARSSKSYIDIHDNLLAIIQMIPDEFDSRREKAEAMFNNNKIVPKKVRQRPERYRR